MTIRDSITAIGTGRRPGRSSTRSWAGSPTGSGCRSSLCHLEGLTYEQAAQRLGCPVRTVQSRLARARERLRDRLARRGVAPAIAALTAALTPDTASAAVSESWKQATVTAAVRFAAGGTVAALIPSSVAVLAEGASRAMNLHRLMKWAAVLLLIGVAAGGAGIAMLARSAPPEPERPTDRCRGRQPISAHRSRAAPTIEVVAVSTVPTGPKTWWRPDGSPLAEAPVDTIESRYPRARRESGCPGDPGAGLRSEAGRHAAVAPDVRTSYWGGRPSKNGRKVPELDYYEATFPPTAPIARSSDGSPPAPGRPRCRTTARAAPACS